MSSLSRYSGATLLLARADCNRHVEAFGARPARDATDRRRVPRVEAGADADVKLVRAAFVRRIEADPAQSLDPQLGPGMGGLVLVAVLIGEEIARDVARGDVDRPRRRDEGMGVVLADAFAKRQRLGGRGVGGRHARPVGDRAGHRARKRMAGLERRAGAGRLRPERRERRIGKRRGRRAQVDEGVDSLAVAPQDAG